MNMNNRIALLVVVLAVHFLALCASDASEARHRAERHKTDTGTSKLSPDGKQLNAAIRDAIFKDRERLLSFLNDCGTHAVICTPAPNDSYELFQASLREQLDILWDLDIYASQYGLSEKQHDAVKACSASMEEYLENFDLWEKLNR